MGGEFWQYVRRMMRYRWHVAAALSFAVLSAGGLGAGLIGVRPVLERVLDPAIARGLPELTDELNSRLPAWAPQVPRGVRDALPQGPFNAVLWIVAGIGVLTVLGATANFLHSYLSLTVISRTIANLRRECFHRVIHLPLRTVLASGPSDLVSRIVYDTSTLAAGFNAMLSRAVAQASKGIAAVAVAFWFDWRLTLAAMAITPVVVWIIRRLGRRIRRASRLALQSQAGLYQSAAEVLGGLRVVKVHGNERGEEGRFHRINKEVVRQEFRVRTARALASPLVETAAILVLGALALIAVKAIIDGHLDRTNSLMVLGSLALGAAQIKPLTAFLNDIQQASAAAARLTQLLGMSVEPGHDSRLPKLPRHRESVRFDDVSFTYPGGEAPAIAGVSLTIGFGETFAFVGPNGCGKTTLLSLIPRLFDPDRGCVLIDGHDVRAYSVRSVRRQIGVVTQETVLFKGTIRANIAYGAEGATEERIRAAARAARAEEFILEKPGGYGFEIAEGGAGLSGGQKQRIAIARAILRDPAILILDEATSMIDAESEAKIAEALGEFVGRKPDGARSDNGGPQRGRTCLIVAHRLSTVVAAEAIVVMDQGKIVDMGKHEELLARCDLYRSLARHQLVPERA